jgi:hypothetical protein
LKKKQASFFAANNCAVHTPLRGAIPECSSLLLSFFAIGFTLSPDQHIKIILTQIIPVIEYLITEKKDNYCLRDRD